MRVSLPALVLVGALVTGTAHADVITFSGTSQVEDTFIADGTEPWRSFNFGGSNVVAVGSYNAGGLTNAHTLIRFLGLDSLQGNTVVSATLTLTYASDDPAALVELYELATVNSGWVEGSSNFDFEAGASSWPFRIYPGTGIPDQVWAGSEGASTAGVDYESPLLDSVALSEAQDNAQVTLEIPAAVVQAWIDDYAAGEKNPGLFLRDANEGLQGFSARFLSSEGGGSVTGPRLTVEYAVPEPSALALLSVAGCGLLRARARRN